MAAKSTAAPLARHQHPGSSYPIVISEDQDDDSCIIVSRLQKERPRPIVIVDDDDDDDYDDDDDEDDGGLGDAASLRKMIHVLDNDEYDSESTLPDIAVCSDRRPAHHSQQTILRGISIHPPSVYINQYRILGKNIRLKVRDTVELINEVENNANGRKRDFFRIQSIIQNLETDKVTMGGWLFRRNYYINAMLPKKLNEVCLQVTIDDNDIRPPLLQGMEEISVDRVYKKRHLIMTNKNFPELSFRRHTLYDSNGKDAAEHKRRIHDNDVLVCRWIFISHIVGGDPRLDSGELRRLFQRECDTNDTSIGLAYSVPDASLTQEWIGYLPCPTSEYTLADAFSGAGGFSEGALQAGAKIRWCLDHDDRACATYRRNRPDVDIYVAKANHFIEISRDSKDLHVAILHISPPCQPYSPAHTHPGQLDEENTATLLSVHGLVTRVKPRVVTLEQTSGIVSHHPLWFRAIVNMLTSIGYSLRWKVASLDQFGVAQKRKRLIMFASCPGGVLPSFPPPTHGPGTSNNYVTVADALRPLAQASNVTYHDVASTIPRSKHPYSPDMPLRGCITTSGGTDYHPSGQRTFTIRELALLQSLPMNFRFGEGQGVTSIRKQIGNMVPPIAAKTLIKAVIRALEIEDGERQRD